MRADRKARLRTLKDLDQAATVLAETCRAVLDETLPDSDLRAAVFDKTPRDVLAQALENACALIRPPHDVYLRELDARYRHVRIFLPALLKHIRFKASPAGEPVVAAFDWLRVNATCAKPANDAPRGIIGKPWRGHVLREDGHVDLRA